MGFWITKKKHHTTKQNSRPVRETVQQRLEDHDLLHPYPYLALLRLHLEHWHVPLVWQRALEVPFLPLPL